MSLSAREASVLRYVRELADVEIAPTVREIAKHEGVGVAAAHKVLSALVDARFLDRTPGKRRGLAPAGHIDLRSVPTARIRAELARRGDTRDALRSGPIASGWRAKRDGGICAADTCGATVPFGHLMCRQHWFSLPADLQQSLKGAHAQACRTNSNLDIARYQRLLTKARDIADGCGGGL